MLLVPKALRETVLAGCHDRHLEKQCWQVAMIPNAQVTTDSKRRCRDWGQNIFGMIYPKIANIMFSLARNVIQVKNLICSQKIPLASTMQTFLWKEYI